MYNEKEKSYNNAENSDSAKKVYRAGLVTGIVWGIGIIFAIIILVNIIAAELENTNDGKIKENITLDDNSKASIIKQYIDKYFMEDMDEDVIVEGMYKGMLESLDDPYSVYYNKEDFASFNEASNGKYTGIGVVVRENTSTKEIVAARIYANSPAEQAGMKVGDVIVAIDGENVRNKSTEYLVNCIRGEEGSKVIVDVERDGQEIELEMTRKIVEVDMVQYEMLEDNIGYIFIDQFSGMAAEQTREAVEDLLEQGMKKVIVDIRDNPGGDLECVRDIVNIFIDKGELVLYSQTKEGKKTNYYTKKDALIKDLPLCVLVNENSASASEVFAGNMKCYDRGDLVGNTTFGKGIMQSIFNLGDGTGLKLTIGKYYLPDDSNIHKTGIEPDYKVEIPDDIYDIWELEHSQDPQLCKAIEILKSKN